MKARSVFDPGTGRFTGDTIRCSEDQLVHNVPPGMEVIDGVFDRICQRFDTETREVVDHQPEAPDDDHEWRATVPDAKDRATQRWRYFKKPEVVEKEAKDRAARGDIASLEVAQARAVREALLALLPDGETKTKLKEIDDQIAEKRPDLIKKLADGDVRADPAAPVGADDGPAR
jgi:hypothetical protein